MEDDEDQLRVNLLDSLRPRLQQLIQVQQVLDLCPSIDANTREAIRQKVRNDGNRNAVDMLITAVIGKPHAPGWFTEFVDALSNGGCKYAADCVQGDCVDPDAEAENDICIRLVELMSPTLVGMKTADVCDQCAARDMLTQEDVDAIRAEINSRNGARILLTRIMRGRPGWFSDFTTVLWDTEHKPLYKELTGWTSPEEQSSAEKLCCSQLDETMDFEVIVQEKPDSTLNLDIPKLPSDNVTMADEDFYNAESTMFSEAAGSLDLPQTDGSSSASCSETAKIVLRDYQMEVAQPALEGKNIIVCLPTGRGKTRVAVYIAKAHLDGRRGGERPGKVVVLVNKVPLVEQHFNAEFKPFLKDLYNVERVSGDSQLKISFTEIFKHNDVIICTAQILENFLDRANSEDDEGIEMSDITLLIIDECHHTQKGEVYNHIMMRYLKQKHKNLRLEREKKEQAPLPQILGLTASPGVGGANKMAKAEEHILKICANLDAYKIMTSSMDSKKSPKKRVATTDIRIEDPFGDVIKKIMNDIHAHANLNPTSELGSQNYELWVGQLERNAAKEANQKVHVCAEHLRQYNEGLQLCNYIRMHDAFNFLNKFYDDERKNKVASEETIIQTTDTERFLFLLFNDKKDELLNIAKKPEHENKSLHELRTIILKEFTMREEPRGIIFTRTRRSAIALSQWIQENSKFDEVGVKAAFLIGGGDQSVVKPMTSAEQKDVLNKFHNGLINLLIATTVAEEGLDIRQCNFVIRYGLVTNEIAMIQAQGRARAEDSSYTLVEVKGSGVTEKEVVNEYREDMMNKAIGKIRSLNRADYEKRIKEFQLAALMEEKMRMKKKSEQQIRKACPSELSLSCRGCNTSVCNGKDIQIIENMHRVNVTQEFRDLFIQRENTSLQERLLDYDTNGFIACKTCGRRWGSMMHYRGIDFPCLDVKNFVVQFGEKKISKCEKWSELPVKFATFDYTEYVGQQDWDDDD